VKEASRSRSHPCAPRGTRGRNRVPREPTESNPQWRERANGDVKHLDCADVALLFAEGAARDAVFGRDVVRAVASSAARHVAMTTRCSNGLGAGALPSFAKDPRLGTFGPCPVRARRRKASIRAVKRVTTATSVRAETARLVAPPSAAATSPSREHRMSGSAPAYLVASDRQQALPRARAAGRLRGTTSREGSAHDRVSCSRSRTTTSRPGTHGLGTPRPRQDGASRRGSNPGGESTNGARIAAAKPRDRARAERSSQGESVAVSLRWKTSRIVRARAPSRESGGRRSRLGLGPDYPHARERGVGGRRSGDGDVRGTRARRPNGKKRPTDDPAR